MCAQGLAVTVVAVVVVVVVFLLIVCLTSMYVSSLGDDVEHFSNRGLLPCLQSLILTRLDY